MADPEAANEALLRSKRALERSRTARENLEGAARERDRLGGSGCHGS